MYTEVTAHFLYFNDNQLSRMQKLLLCDELKATQQMYSKDNKESYALMRFQSFGMLLLFLIMLKVLLFKGSFLAFQ